MRALSPATRQKLAILLKSRDKQQGLPIPQAGAVAPQMPQAAPMGTPLNPSMGPSTAQILQQKPLFAQGEKELSPHFFSLKKKLRAL